MERETPRERASERAKYFPRGILRDTLSRGVAPDRKRIERAKKPGMGQMIVRVSARVRNRKTEEAFKRGSPLPRGEGGETQRRGDKNAEWTKGERENDRAR